jgi:hypothetical protein
LSDPDVWGAGHAPWHYVLAFVVYVALGVLTRSVVLNWIVGPLFLLLALYVVPRLVEDLIKR